MSKLFYITENYKPKGNIEGYPLEVVDRMIHEQVKQGNKADVQVFEKFRKAGYPHGGFYWSKTEESRVWEDICFDENFTKFYENYGKEHITQEEFNEVNGATYLKDIKNTHLTPAAKSNRQSRLKVNISVLKNFKPLKVKMDLSDGVWFDDRVYDLPEVHEQINYENGTKTTTTKHPSGLIESVTENLDSKDYARQSEKSKKEALKSLKKAEKTEKDVREKSKEHINEAFSKVRENYDFINPDHYKTFEREVWEMMVDIWGAEKFIAHCEMCAFKYRMRLGSKPNQPIERDLKKAKWYEDKAKELKTNEL